MVSLKLSIHRLVNVNVNDDFVKMLDIKLMMLDWFLSVSAGNFSAPALTGFQKTSLISACLLPTWISSPSLSSTI